MRAVRPMVRLRVSVPPRLVSREHLVDDFCGTGARSSTTSGCPRTPSEPLTSSSYRGPLGHTPIVNLMHEGLKTPLTRATVAPPMRRTHRVEVPVRGDFPGCNLFCGTATMTANEDFSPLGATPRSWRPRVPCCGDRRRRESGSAGCRSLALASALARPSMPTSSSRMSTRLLTTTSALLSRGCRMAGISH